MFILKSNKEIGKYLGQLIDQDKRYRSRRDFCKSWLEAEGHKLESIDTVTLGNKSNALSAITRGKNALQMDQLKIFVQLLDVSCEQLLSCGENCLPVSSHVTNYQVALSHDKKVWEDYINRGDKRHCVYSLRF